MVTTVNSCRLQFGRFELQAAARVLLADGVPVALGSRAFDVLTVLVEERSRVVGKDELLERVWPGSVVEENTLQVHVSTLRKILGADAITTIAGHGYRFTAATWAAPFADGAAVGHDATLALGLHNLPSSRNRFIGRDVALAQCEGLLQHARLLTLTGIGGCGKTRLALQLAERLMRRFGDGVWFVDLAPWQAPQHMVAALANATGVREEAGTPTLERLVAHLRRGTTLLVLDNCEHLIDAVADLVDTLITSCDSLKIVATSRERLGVEGEQLFPLGTLTLPAADDLASVLCCDSARLFVDRAARVSPDFKLDADNAAAISAICLRVDGIALAIELAAARIGMLSVEQINDRLADRFPFLVGTPRALARHQTLQATLQWSYDSLPAQEQQLFRHLAVFGGGWTLTAATHISAAADEDRVLGLLTRLHDKSLIAVDRRGQAPTRYRMLETVRQYAKERLDAAGEDAAARDRHLQCFVALAEQASTQLQGPQQGAWMADVAAEQDNLLAAHDWCLSRANLWESALRLVASLWRYWVASGQLERGHAVAEAALSIVSTPADAPWRGRASWAAGQIAFRMGRYAESLAHADMGLDIAVAHGDAEQIAAGLGLRAKGLHSTGHPDQALLQYEQACEVARTLNDSSWLGTALNNLAELHRSKGNHGRAQACYEEAIGIARHRQSPEGIFVPLCNLARLSLSCGQRDRAHALLLESLQLASSAELKGMSEDVLEVAAGLASVREQYDQAARFAGAALSRMRESGSQREPVDQAFVEPLLVKARSALGLAGFDAAEAEGVAWSHDAAIQHVRRWLIAARPH